MRSRIMRVVLLFGVTVGLLATAAPPASATVIKNGTFVGDATLSRGLGYPCTPAGTTTLACVADLTDVTVKNDPKNVPQVNYSGGGNTAGFVFQSDACVDEGVSTSTTKKDPTATAGACFIRAAGTVTGYCGLSTGTGTATYTSSNGDTYGTMIKFTGLGGTLVVSGGNKLTNVRAVVEAVPVPSATGESCTNKTQTTFMIAGNFTYKDCTPGSPVSGVCPPL